MPDSHLEAAFEDSVSGGWEDAPEPYEPGPYTGDEPDWDGFCSDEGGWDE